MPLRLCKYIYNNNQRLYDEQNQPDCLLLFFYISRLQAFDMQGSCEAPSMCHTIHETANMKISQEFNQNTCQTKITNYFVDGKCSPTNYIGIIQYKPQAQRELCIYFWHTNVRFNNHKHNQLGYGKTTTAKSMEICMTIHRPPHSVILTAVDAGWFKHASR